MDSERQVFREMRDKEEWRREVLGSGEERRYVELLPPFWANKGIAMRIEPGALWLQSPSRPAAPQWSGHDFVQSTSIIGCSQAEFSTKADGHQGSDPVPSCHPDRVPTNSIFTLCSLTDVGLVTTVLSGGRDLDSDGQEISWNPPPLIQHLCTFATSL
jgi:hypothetical protein